MATPANGRSTLGESLKIVYEPGLNEAIQKEVFFFSDITKKTFEGRGKQYTFATHLKRNTVVASRAGNGYYATAQGETLGNGTVNVAYVHIPFEIENDLVEASKGGDRIAFKEGMRIVMDTSQETLRRDLNRQAVGDQRGILFTTTASVTSGSATATVACDSTRFLEDGLRFELWNGAAVSNVTRRNTQGGPYFEVSSITDDLNFVVKMVDGSNVPAGIVANDVGIRFENITVNTNRISYEANGLRLFADDGTLDPTGGLHGLSSSTFSRWKGIQVDAGGQSTGPAFLARAMIQFRQRSNTRPTTAYCHDNQAYGLLYGRDGSYKDLRFAPGQVESVGGDHEDIVVNVSGRKIQVKCDIDMPLDTLYLFDKNQLRYVEMHGIKLDDLGDGDVLTLWRDATGARPAQVGYWMWRGNFACVMRNAVARIFNLETPVGLA